MQKLTVKETASHFEVSAACVYGWIKKKLISATNSRPKLIVVNDSFRAMEGEKNVYPIEAIDQTTDQAHQDEINYITDDETAENPTAKSSLSKYQYHAEMARANIDNLKKKLTNGEERPTVIFGLIREAKSYLREIEVAIEGCQEPTEEEVNEALEIAKNLVNDTACESKIELLREQLEADIKASTDTISALRKENEVLQKDISGMAQAESHLKLQIKDFQKYIGDLGSANEDIYELKAENKELKESLAKAAAHTNNLREQNMKLLTRPTQTQFDELQAHVQRLEDSNQGLFDQNAELSQNNSKLIIENEHLKQSTKISPTCQQCPSMQKSIDDYHRNLEKIVQEGNRRNATIKSLEVRLEKYEPSAERRNKKSPADPHKPYGDIAKSYLERSKPSAYANL